MNKKSSKLTVTDSVGGGLGSDKDDKSLQSFETDSECSDSSLHSDNSLVQECDVIFKEHYSDEYLAKIQCKGRL